MKLQSLKKIGTGLLFLAFVTTSSVVIEADKAEAHDINWCGRGTTRGRVERFVFIGRKILRAELILGVRHIIYLHEVRVEKREDFGHAWREDHIDEVVCTFRA